MVLAFHVPQCIVLLYHQFPSLNFSWSLLGHNQLFLETNVLADPYPIRASYSFWVVLTRDGSVWAWEEEWFET